MKRMVARLVLAFLLVVPAALWAEADRPGQAAIASAHFMATEAGHEILAQGGNAFDAAIAVAAALAVVEPTSSGIGGGGFWLLHRAEDGFQVMVDAREKAPAAAHRDMYLDEDGAVNRDLAINGPLAGGIPGEVAGFEHLARHYGRLPLSVSLLSLLMLEVAEAVNRDVFSVIVPLACLAIFGFASFQKPARQSNNQERSL